MKFSDIKAFIEEKGGIFFLLASAALWLMVWATYNTDVFRIFSPGWPHDKLDLFHGARAILPFLALVPAIIILIRNKKFNLNLLKGPLGLLLLYTIVGIVASVISKNPLVSLYWGILYGTALMVILAIAAAPDPAKTISFVMRINLIIAAVIAVGLVAILFLKPGVFSFSTVIQFLQGRRPYESLGDIPSQINLFGMPGSRPTGLGRYAGLAAIIIFANLWCKNKGKKTKIFLFFLFFIFLSILIFSRARTSAVAFLIAIFLISFFKSKSKGPFILKLSSILILLYFVNFYSFFWAYFTSENLLETVSSSAISSESSGMDIHTALTLSGRTNTVWPEVWHLFSKSPLIGWGFHADRIFLNGLHTHNFLLQALVQSGALGTLFFVLAFIISWIALLYLFKKNPGNAILIETLGIMAYFTIRGITESSAFFGADYLFLVPVFAYLQFFPKEKISAGNIKKLLSVEVSGNKINLPQIQDVLNLMEYWIKNESQKSHWVVVTGMHGIVESYKNPEFKKMLNSADLFLPDGISLVWLGRLKGFDIKKRVSGADLMKEWLLFSKDKGYKNFFYGDMEDTLRALSANFPGIKSDYYSPPFRNLTPEEDAKIIEKINQAKPDILWVGLGLPKQEKWVFEHREKLNVPVIIGVGAAFKFLSGKVKRAPAWVGNFGFEWLWRLFQEPKIIWTRVFIDGPIFIWIVLMDFLDVSPGKKSAWSFIRIILLFFEKNILFPIGIFIGPKLLEQLTPYDAKGFEKKIRLGNLGDGGYVVPYEILYLIDAAYSYGVENNVNFEKDLIKIKDIPVRLYDYSIDDLPEKNKNFFFKKEGVATKKKRVFDTFENHLKENNETGKKVLLKLDIEGAEWEVLNKILGGPSENIVAIVLELHRLQRYEKMIRYIKILKKINSKFTLVHLHGNNNSKLFVFGNKKIPSTLELTFINNNLINEKTVMVSSLPSEQDYPNLPWKKDIPLDFWKKNTR